VVCQDVGVALDPKSDLIWNGFGVGYQIIKESVEGLLFFLKKPTGLKKKGGSLNPNPAFEKSRFVREGRRTVVV